MFLRRLLSHVAILAVISSLAPAQSLLSGDIAGTVLDPSGAAAPAAAVSLRSLDTGSIQTGATNAEGSYRFTLLRPGRYSVTVTLAGFQKISRQVDVAAGQVVRADLELVLGQESQTVQVSEAAPLLNPEASINTPFSALEFSALPSAGGDITNIAFSAPGVVVNNSGGTGNFSINGLPGTSNLFTVNGENAMDPYFNVNMSGATNLTLGQNELEEANIIANPYGGEYGQLSGAQVIYTTKSGSNEFHGNANYFWNGRDMNANDWFNNLYGVGRPFSNANQWATSLGGPIRRNKTFFFVDQEGIRFVIPDVQSVTIPTPAFASAVIANIGQVAPSELSAYKTMMNLWDTAPGAAGALTIPNSSYCNSVVLPGYNPATTPCAEKFQAAPSGLASEWILAFRIDQKISDFDSAFYRYKLDRGVQPTGLDPVNPNFNVISSQPEFDNQFEETHIFGPRATNQFIASLSHYDSEFSQNSSEVASTFPYGVTDSGAVPFTSFNPQGVYPQGRNITQYQFIDDVTVLLGKHSLKFGENFRRYDVSDHNFLYTNPAVYFGYTNDGLQKFVDGLAYQYRKSLTFSNDVPVAMWGLGTYAHDDWSVAPNLKITLGLRAEHNSNPVCQFQCFANFRGPVDTLASFTSANPGSVPYSADLATNLHSAFHGVDAVNWAPSVGFSWSPRKDSKTILSGGFGVFYDNPPTQIVDDLLQNPPATVPIRVRPAAGVLPYDPGPNGGAGIWAASASSFSINQTYAQISSTLKNLGALYAAPSVTAITGTIHSPRVYQWNFEVQHQFTQTTALTVNYVGNHSENVLYTNPWANAFDEYGLYNNVAGVPEAAPVPNYGSVNTIQNGGISNYDGLQISFRKQVSRGLMFHVNYTWSHALDNVSNGGVFGYASTVAPPGDALMGQLSPLGLNVLNYSNADYDIRHQFSADYVYMPSFHVENALVRELVNGWEWSGKLNARSGLPFSVVDNNTALGNYTGSLLATQIGPNAQTSCGAAAALTPCLNAGAFLNAAAPTFMAYNALSSATRNEFRGPHYFDFDMALFRSFRIRERARLAIGLQAFNVFNHPNFGLPDAGVGDQTFGIISSMASTPTSPYGTFLGFDSSPRVAQLTGKITF